MEELEILAEAIAITYGAGTEPTDLDREDATTMHQFLADNGWRLVKEDTEGGISRALGME